jgi:MFS transporter, CP family, cyanate transporter
MCRDTLSHGTWTARAVRGSSGYNCAVDPDDRPLAARRPATVGGALALVAVALVSVDLRPGATSVGPVLAEASQALGMGTTAAGALTALPGLCFAAVGALAVALARRVGVSGGLALGLVAVTVGLFARSVVGSAAAFGALTVLALGGMAVGNVLAPAWIKRHSADGSVALMTVYGTGLVAGGALGSLLAAPLSDAAPGGWRAALGVWALLAAVTVVPWWVIARREHTDPADHDAPMVAPQGRLRTSRTAVALAAYFGVQSMNAYVQFGWLPQIYRDAGLPAVTAGTLLAWLSALGIVGGLVMPRFVARAPDVSWAVWWLGAALLAGYVGLLLAPADRAWEPWLWATLLGVAGWSFPAAIAMITVRTRDPRVTAQLSGFVQPAGYLLAAAGPFLVGVMHSVGGGWTAVLLFLAASAVAMTAAGLLVARPRFVDDELAASPAGP